MAVGDGSEGMLAAERVLRCRGARLTDPVSVRSLGLRVEKRGELVSRPAGRTSWLLLFLHSPALVGRALAPVEAGSAILWPAGGPQRYGWRGERWQHSWLHLSGAPLAAWAADLGLPLGRPIPGLPAQQLEATLRELAEELERRAPDGVLVANLVHNLLRRLARSAGAAGLGPGAPSPLDEVREWLDYHFSEPVSLGSLARRCGWSLGHFCLRFKARFGVPAYEYLLRLRLAQARLLLADPGRSVASVARELGWSDLRSFRRLVRRRLGRSPEGLRPG